MRSNLLLSISLLFLLACQNQPEPVSSQSNSSPLAGTWKLISGTLIENGDTTVTDYTRNLSFIKIINDTHFAFLQHDLNQGKDSTASFVAGGGSYTLRDSLYTENLEYCSDRQWENNHFDFTISVKGDTLVQQGIEKVENAGVNRLNLEKYVRLK